MTNAHLNIITCRVMEFHTEPWWSVGTSAPCALIVTLLTIPEWIIRKKTTVHKAVTLISRLTIVVISNIIILWWRIIIAIGTGAVEMRIFSRTGTTFSCSSSIAPNVSARFAVSNTNVIQVWFINHQILCSVGFCTSKCIRASKSVANDSSTYLAVLSMNGIEDTGAVSNSWS